MRSPPHAWRVRRRAQLGPVPVAGSEKRKQWVLRTLVRRGTAHIQLEEWQRAFEDYAIAAQIDPGNEELRQDLAHIGAKLTPQQAKDGEAAAAEKGGVEGAGGEGGEEGGIFDVGRGGGAGGAAVEANVPVKAVGVPVEAA